MTILVLLFILLMVAWIFGFLLLHLAGALIHLLPAVAVIVLIVYLLRGASRRRPA